MTGSHEVRGSIPLGSTNNLCNRLIRRLSGRDFQRIQVGKNLATIATLHPLVIPSVVRNRLFSEQRAELLSIIRSAMSGGTPESPSGTGYPRFFV